MSRSRAIAVLTGLAAACSKPHLTPSTVAQLEDRLRQAVTRRAAPAIAVAVVANDGPDLVRAEGLRDLASRTPVGTDTRFAWFSVTKIVTATAVMQLVEQGRVELDRPVRDYVPSFPAEIPNGGEVTVRQLLSHTSGLANPIPVGWVHAANEPGPDLDDLTARLLARHARLLFRPGTRFAYSNLGYLVLGQLVERVSGERYPAYVRRHILDPLGCTGAGFGPAGGDAATGYSRTWSAMGIAGRFIVDGRFLGDATAGFTAFRPFLVDGAPYGGLVGSARDLGRVVAAHLRGGELADNGSSRRRRRSRCERRSATRADAPSPSASDGDSARSTASPTRTTSEAGRGSRRS